MPVSLACLNFSIVYMACFYLFICFFSLIKSFFNIEVIIKIWKTNVAQLAG